MVYIIGITRSYMYVSQKYKKKVWFFDDSHNLEYECFDSDNVEQPGIMVGDYIANVVSSTDKTIDLFVELPYKTSDADETQQYMSYLSNIEERFHHALSYNKRNREYRNVRAHYGDTRDLLEHFNPSFYIFLKEITNCYYFGMNKPEVWSEHLIAIKDVFESKDTYIQFLKDFMSYTKIDKQIQNIEDSVIANKLIANRDALLRYYHDNTLSYDDIVRIMNSLKPAKRNERNKERISIVFRTIVQSLALVMDMYILARMFRRFSDGSELENIIIDAGSAHTSFYYLFLEDCGFTRVLDTDSGDNEADESGCVNIPQAFLDEFLQHQLMV